jgi:hypothetical protein
MITSGTPANKTVLVHDSIVRGFKGDTMQLTFSMRNPAAFVANKPWILVKILLSDGTTDYSLDNNKNWVLSSLYRCAMTGNYSAGDEDNFSISIPALPISGRIYLQFEIGDTGETVNDATIGKFALTASSPNVLKQVKGFSEFNSIYTKTITTIMGSQIANNYVAIGALLSNFQVLNGWYRFEVTESFTNLPRLLIQQYINIQSTAQINMQGTIMSIFGPDAPISILNSFYFQDGTTTLPVEGLPYTCGNMRINYTDDEYSGTWLQISNTEITEDITDIIIQKT